MNRGVAGLCVLACGLLVASPAWAKRLTAESFHSDIQVQTDGSAQVTETVRFRFHGGPFESLTRTVPRRQFDGIEMLSSSDPYHFVGEGRRARLRWTFTPIHDTVRTFTLEYRVRGAVEVRDGERRLDWPVVPRNRRYRIENASAEVHWPAAWTATRVRASGRPVTQTPESATFERRKLDDDDSFVLRAQFTSADPLPVPAWQVVRDGQRQHLQTIALCAGAVLLLGLGLVFAQAREAGVSQPRIEPQQSVHAPPADLPPALAGAIWRGSSNWGDLVATLVDLAQRGYVVVEAQHGKRWWSSGAWNLRRTSLATGLAAWERIVLESVFHNADEHVVPAARVWTPLSRKKGEFAAAIRAQLRQRGLYDAHAEEAQSRLRGTGAVWLAAAAALAAATPLVWRTAGAGALLLPLAPLVVALIAFALSSSIPRHSPLGRRSAAAWGGYREFLSRVPESQKPPSGSTWFEQQLGYALALGVSKPWLMAAAKWPPAVPAWFRLPAEGGGGIADVLSWLASIASAEAQSHAAAVEPALAAALMRRRVA